MLRPPATPHIRSKKNQLFRCRPAVELLEDRLAPATLHWTGAAGASWSAANNWLENQAPGNGDVVAFDTAAAAVQGFTSNNDIPNLGLAGLIVNDTDAVAGHDFSITGNGVYLAGGLTHSMVGVATSLGLSAITLQSPAAWTNNSGTLNLGSDVNLNGMGLTVTGGGNTTLLGVVSGLNSNTGLRGDYYQLPWAGAQPFLLDPASGAWLGFRTPTVSAITGLVEFPRINPNSFTTSANVTYANVGATDVAARWTGYINIPTTGTVNLYTASDDGSRLFIDGALVVENNFFQGNTFRGGSIDLTAGLHAIDIEYFQGGADGNITAFWDPTGTGNNVAVIPPEVFSLSNGLTKEGTGTLTLANANTYLGATVVNAGTLLVNGSLAAASAVTVNSGGTLGGTGTVGGAVTVNPGGAINPGASPGTLSVGDLVFSAGSTFDIDLGGAASDQLGVTGTVALNGATLSASLAAAPAPGQTFVVINNDANDAVFGTFAGLPEGAAVTFGGHRFFISYQGGDGNDVVLTADHAPVAGAGTLSYSTNTNQTLNVPAPGLLAGASDPDGDPIRPVLGTGPTHGSLTLQPDGSFTYTPAANYSGPDSFTYVVSDGEFTSGTVTVSLTVLATNRAPTAAADSYSTPKNEPLVVAAPGVLANDADPDGDTLSAVLVSGPSNGVLTLNGNGSFIYTPNPGFSGSDSFTYKASDGSLDSAPVIVTLNVADTASTKIKGKGSLVLGFERTALSRVPVATFQLGNGTVPPGSITALINWGDGTRSLGTVSLDGTTYTVHGSHTYRNDGIYAVTVTVSSGNAAGIIRGAALILDKPHHGWHHHHNCFVSLLYRQLIEHGVNASSLAQWLALFHR